MFRERIKFVFALILICKYFLHPVISLRCRTDDGPSEADLKRVIRTCMRKFGENVTAADLNMQHLQQQQQQQNYMNRAYSDNRFNGAFGPPISGYSRNFNDYQSYYDDDDDANYYTQYYNNNNNQQQQFQNQYRSGQSNQQRTFDYIYNDNYNNNNNNNNKNINNKDNNNNNNNSHGRQSNNQSNRSRDNNNNNNNNNNNKGNNHNIQNHNKDNRNTTEGFCLVHCFFEQMHMLNERHYPDRRKVLFVLTQGIRNTELRNFYTDTIQECFRYVETQRQRGDKCQFATDLINCMAEYAKGNCDDWNEFNMMFN